MPIDPLITHEFNLVSTNRNRCPLSFFFNYIISIHNIFSQKIRICILEVYDNHSIIMFYSYSRNLLIRRRDLVNINIDITINICYDIFNLMRIFLPLTSHVTIEENEFPHFLYYIAATGCGGHGATGIQHPRNS